MSQFPYLTEARIRDYERRREAGETRSTSAPADGGSLESMLFDEIIELRRQLREAQGERGAEALRQEIGALETQLLISLESTGRPLLARVMAERLEEEARRER